MSSLVFYYGTMSSGKTTLGLQIRYTAVTEGYEVLLLTCSSRTPGRVVSRIGVDAPAIEITESTDLWKLLAERADPHSVIVDEAQFLTPCQVNDLAFYVDETNVPVYAFGLMTTFSQELFPGSRQLINVGAELIHVPCEALCWCGQQATHNARVISGEVVKKGPPKLVGDIGGEVGYQVLCRVHYRSGQLRPN